MTYFKQEVGTYRGHWHYICDTCSKDFRPRMYEYVYKLGHGKDEKQFCSYNCRCEYIKKAKKKRKEARKD